MWRRCAARGGAPVTERGSPAWAQMACRRLAGAARPRGASGALAGSCWRGSARTSCSEPPGEPAATHPAFFDGAPEPSAACSSGSTPPASAASSSIRRRRGALDRPPRRPRDVADRDRAARRRSALRARHPRLVVASITPFGQAGRIATGAPPTWSRRRWAGCSRRQRPRRRPAAALARSAGVSPGRRLRRHRRARRAARARADRVAASTST